MSKRFIVPTKENRVAIWCSDKHDLDIAKTVYDLPPVSWSSGCYIICNSGSNSLSLIDGTFRRMLMDGYNVIPLEAALNPSRSRLAEVLGVEDKKVFAFRGANYIIRPNEIIHSGPTPTVKAAALFREILPNTELSEWVWCDTAHLLVLIAFSDEIKPVMKPTFGSGTKKIAEALKTLGYTWIARNSEKANYSLNAFSSEPIRTRMNDDDPYEWFTFKEITHEIKCIMAELAPDSCMEITWENSPISIAKILGESNA